MSKKLGLGSSLHGFLSLDENILWNLVSMPNGQSLECSACWTYFPSPMKRQQSPYFIITILLLTQFTRSAPPINCDKYKQSRPSIFYVEGTASINMPTTIGTVIFEVSTIDRVASIALKQANEQLNQAVEYQQLYIKSAIKSLDVKFTTTGLSVQREYKEMKDPGTNISRQLLQGYRVRNTLTVRTLDLSVMGRIIDRGILNGFKKIQSVSFEIDPKDEKAMKNELIDQAVKDAQARARLALEPLGMQIVSVYSVSLNEYTPYYYHQSYDESNYAMALAESAPTEVFAAQQNVEMHATIGFAIKLKQQQPLIKGERTVGKQVKVSTKPLP